MVDLGQLGFDVRREYLPQCRFEVLGPDALPFRFSIPASFVFHCRLPLSVLCVLFFSLRTPGPLGHQSGASPRPGGCWRVSSVARVPLRFPLGGSGLFSGEPVSSRFVFLAYI